MTTVKTQNQLFGKLKLLLGRKDFAVRIADALYVSTSAAYRRINGETLLSFEDLLNLRKNLDLPFSEMLDDESESRVTFDFLTETSDSLTAYINSITNYLTEVRKEEDHELIVSSKEIPIWHFFKYEKLRAFKLFLWLKSIEKDEDYQLEKFSFDSIPVALHKAAETSCREYSKTNSEEIWTMLSITKILTQFRYFLESDIISKEHVSDLLNELEIVITDLRKDVEYKSKITSGNSFHASGRFGLYITDIVGGENLIYARSGSSKRIFQPPILLNFLVTKNEEYCKYIYKGLLTTKEIAENISETSEKRKNHHFKEFERQIEQFRSDYLSINSH